MKKAILRIITLLLCVCLSASVFSSCSKKDKPIDFIYPFSGNVNSYDPQVAATSDEYLIVENTFEGLIRIDDNGKVKPGVAESWSISDNGKTYTFKIQKGLKWDIRTDKYTQGEKKGEFRDSRLQFLGREFNPDITAHDFVFALRRAVDSNTQCPLFSSLSSIKNATAINSGKMKTSALGVKAIDDYTLEIQLNGNDSSFMETLTSAAAMPCNEEFFNATKGKYGLSTKYTLFNGQFYVYQILESSYLLKNNEYYKGPSPTKATELTLKIPDEDESKKTVERLVSGYYDAAYITSEQSEQIKDDSGLTFIPYNDSTLAFVFNTAGEVFQSKMMRKAFCLGFSRDEKTEKEYLAPAMNLIPSSSKIGSKKATDLIGTTVKKQNQTKSNELFKKAIDILKINDISVTVITTPQLEETAKLMLQGIQSGIGAQTKNKSGDTINFTLKVKSLEKSELSSAMAKGEYDIAFVEYKATSNSALSFLRNSFLTNSGVNKTKLENALLNAEKTSDINKKAEYVKKAEEIIIESYSVCPVLWQSGYFALARGVKNVQFHVGTGRVSFVNAQREKE
ncbi:MAG: peptide ABC transporter substrate-binding protein [Eubacterium sp.]|nr:peptide ABC transporter substrate-binding protein [Eubacterium sp.]